MQNNQMDLPPPEFFSGGFFTSVACGVWQTAFLIKRLFILFGFLFYFPLYEPEKVVYNIPIMSPGVRYVNCLKCGREIDEGQVFCNDCLVGMAKYPVKPGTAVLLPSRGDAAVSKKAHSRRRGKAAAEEQLKALKKRVRLLSFLLVVCMALILVLSVVTFRCLKEDNFLPGQNYSAVNATEASQGD